MFFDFNASPCDIIGTFLFSFANVFLMGKLCSVKHVYDMFCKQGCGAFIVDLKWWVNCAYSSKQQSACMAEKLKDRKYSVASWSVHRHLKFEVLNTEWTANVHHWLTETFPVLIRCAKFYLLFVNALFNVPLHVHLKKWTSKFKPLYDISYFNEICRICCVNTHIWSLIVWLKSVLKYISFSRGFIFIGTPGIMKCGGSCNLLYSKFTTKSVSERIWKNRLNWQS